MQHSDSQLSATSSEEHCKLWHYGHKVIILQKVIRRFIRRGQAARGSSFWGDVQVSLFPTEEPTDEKEEKIGKKKKKKVALAFDARVFRSQYEFTFPGKAIEVAKRRPEERSEHDIRFIRSMMMGILSFRRYSTQMQFMLARVVYYRRFGRGRVIVRKGHRGDSFYFVFSGAIAVTQDEDGSSALLDPEPILLRKGASFGEVALLKGLRRNATVICMEDTEFLVVDRQEFFRNKLDQELKKELQYRYDFFRSLDLFSSWTDEALETLADHCKTGECHHSQVMVNDTSETKNIIFVTKGRCEVLRLVDLSQCPAFIKWIKQHEALLGRSILPQETSSTARKICRKTSNFQTESRDIRAEKRRHLESRALLTAENMARRIGLNVSSTDVSQGLHLPKGLAAAVYLRIDCIHPGQYFKGVDVHYIETCLERDGRLHQKQTEFVLPQLDHRDSRSMAIISQGAEFIRIKLDKFSELADFTTLKKLKAQVHPYPSDNELCKVFLEQNRWKVFKTDMVNHLSAGLNPHLKQSSWQFWTTPKPQRSPNPESKEEEELPPIQLIHGIDIPKQCGKRIMW